MASQNKKLKVVAEKKPLPCKIIVALICIGLIVCLGFIVLLLKTILKRHSESNTYKYGVVVKASDVEVATPYFIADPERVGYPIRKAAALFISNNHGMFIDEHIVQYNVDFNETTFSLISNNFPNSFIALCHVAFAEHRPMALTPDLLWHYIMKGISIHINKYSEELRKKFVSHEGKKELVVNVQKHAVDLDVEDWSRVFKDFRYKIEANLTEEGKTLISKKKFSTTSDVIDDVSCIALMDAMSEYFKYRVKYICGIPSVSLLGRKDDWMELRKRAERALNLLSTDDLKGDVSLSWWKGSLLPVLDKLIDCYENPELEANREWMARIYKTRRKSLGCTSTTLVTGWVNAFFPYFGTSVEDSYINRWSNLDLIKASKEWMAEEDFNGNELYDYPASVSTVDFIFEDHGYEQKMEMYGGPCCLSEQVRENELPTAPGTLHAHFGWLIKRSANFTSMYMG